MTEIIHPTSSVTRPWPFEIPPPGTSTLLNCGLERPHPADLFPPLSARDAIIDEIKTAPKSLVREAYDFVLFLKRRRSLEHEDEKSQTATAKPDFLARQRALFGNRALPDSQAILDELRADRF